MTAVPQKLGRFGHDANPAIDFDLEVRALYRRMDDAVYGVPHKGGQEPEKIEAVSDAIDLALTFNVGGDQRAVAAKNDLRTLRARADHVLGRLRGEQYEVEGQDQLRRLRAYFSRIEARVEGSDGSATQGTELCEKIVELLEQLIEVECGLPSLPSFTNAAPVR